MVVGSPACGDNIEDLIGGSKARGDPTGFELPPRLIIPLIVRGASPFVLDEFSDRSGYSLGGTISPEQLAYKHPAEKEIDEIYLADLKHPVENCLGQRV